MKAFEVVTGGAGFIGSHIAQTLLENGRQVRILDNFSTGKRRNVEPLLSSYPADCSVWELDIRDGKSLSDALDGADTVFHQAAMTSVEESIQNPRKVTEQNIDGTVSVLVAARASAVRKVVFASSTAVYGNSEELPKREDMAVDPVSPYAASKYAGEMYCRIFAQLYDLPTVCLRYFNVYGPRQDPASPYAAAIPLFVSRMLAGRRPTVYGDGEQSRDFVFVKDVVAANLLAAESDCQGLCLNVASGRRLSINALIESLNHLLGTDLSPLYETARSGEVRHSEADIALAKTKIGFSSGYAFEEGLRQTVEWFRKQADS